MNASTNANPNFADLLDKPSSEIEKPKPVPQGTYQFSINGLYKEGKSTQKQTPYVEFTCNYMAALDDVDEAALAEMGGVNGKTSRLTFYITEDSTYRLKKFLVEDLLLEEGDKSLRQLLDETPGCQFLGAVKHEASKDGTSVFANIATTAPVE